MIDSSWRIKSFRSSIICSLHLKIIPKESHHNSIDLVDGLVKGYYPVDVVWSAGNEHTSLRCVAEKTSYFCLALKLIWPLWSSHIFTQWGWLILFSPNHFPGQHKKRWKPATLPLLQNLSSRTDVLSVRSLQSSRITTPWGKPSNLWTSESTLLDQGMYLIRHSQEHFYVASEFCYVYSDA